MKEYIKLGFGLALGACLFKMCAKVTDDAIGRKFDKDVDFQQMVKKLSPTLFKRYYSK